MKQNVVALASGTIFGLGLCISRMIDPQVVIGFLDITGRWNPALLFVMAGALIVSIIAFRFILKRSKPVCCEEFSVPKNNTIDGRLISGSILFGIGWGLAGICPGPAVAALVFGLTKSFVFVLAMLIGMAVYQFLNK